MEQLLLHLFGDYIVQNDIMATRKKEKSINGLLLCLLHCITYSLPFFLITNWKSVILIFVGHFILDRWNLLIPFIKSKNMVSFNNNFGYKESTPFALSVWLYIIQDNTLHLIWNYLIIYLFK